MQIKISLALLSLLTVAHGQGINIQTFTGAVGAPIEPVTFTAGAARPFDIAGDTFINGQGALTRACDRQFNACANAANGGGGGSVSECDAQKGQCSNSIQASLALSTGNAATPIINNGATPVVAANGVSTANPGAANAKAAANGGINIQTFTGAVGAPIEPVTFTAGAARPFDIAGDTFINGQGALTRACDRQFNACANAANSGGGGSVSECDAQKGQCSNSIPASLALSTGGGAGPSATPLAGNGAIVAAAKSAATATPGNPPPAKGAKAANGGINIQTFTGALGAPIEPVTFTKGADRPFDIAGDTFINGAGALNRACDRQFNACATAANSGGGGSVSACDAQKQQCAGTIQASAALAV